MRQIHKIAWGGGISSCRSKNFADHEGTSLQSWKKEGRAKQPTFRASSASLFVWNVSVWHFHFAEWISAYRQGGVDAICHEALQTLGTSESISWLGFDRKSFEIAWRHVFGTKKHETVETCLSNSKHVQAGPAQARCVSSSEARATHDVLATSLVPLRTHPRLGLVDHVACNPLGTATSAEAVESVLSILKWNRLWNQSALNMFETCSTWSSRCLHCKL